MARLTQNPRSSQGGHTLNAVYTWLFSLLLAFATLNGMDGFGYAWAQPFLILSYIDKPSAWMGQLYLFPLLGSYYFARKALIQNHGHAYFEIIARLGLASSYLYSAIHKAADPYQFAQLIKMYQFLPCGFVDLFALIAPWFWILVSFALILGPRTRMNAALYTLVMISFMIALGQAALRALPISCGCFDLEGVEPSTSAALVRDIVFVIPALWLCLKGKQVWIWELFARK